MFHSPGHGSRGKIAVSLASCAVFLLLTPSPSLAQKVRVIGVPNGDLAADIMSQVQAVPFCTGNNTPILLQAEKVKSLTHTQAEEIKATVRAGYSVVMLSPKMEHVRALDRLAGGGVTLRAPVNYPIQAYSLRMVNGVPTAFLLHTAPAPEIASTSEPPGVKAGSDSDTMHAQAVEHTLVELNRLPTPTVGRPVKDPSQPINWQDSPLAVKTLAFNTVAGVYNTYVSVYALHSCLENTDHYVVTALADWTPTNAHFQSAGTEDGSLSADNDGNPVVNWQNTGGDASVGYCGAPSFLDFNSHICGYVNYPLSYRLTMTPPPQGTVDQINAAPAATQGQTQSYSSGFQFSVGGTVNVSATGPGAGLSAGATWSDIHGASVPALMVDAGNTGNEGVFWTFQYCTSGQEADGGNCTNHVQTTNGCRNRFGSDNDPQNGQTPNGKFSNAEQSVRWEAFPDTRVQGQTFDITVSFTANLADTVAELWGAADAGAALNYGGCSIDNCSCTSYTTNQPETSTFIFEIPYPSTQCTAP